MRNLDIFCAEKKAMVMAQIHSSNRGWAGERSWKQSLNQESKNADLQRSIFQNGPSHIVCVRQQGLNAWLIKLCREKGIIFTSIW